MKFQITFKDPDGVYESLIAADFDFNNLPEDVENCIEKYILFREYIIIEFDTKRGTAKVIWKDIQ